MHAYQAFKKGDIDGAVKFFDEAVNLETDNVKKAEKAYAAAAVLASAKKLSQARAYCQKAIGFNLISGRGWDGSPLPDAE